MAKSAFFTRSDCRASDGDAGRRIGYGDECPTIPVDLRKYASPVGERVRLSPSYSILEFQRMQGDAQDFSYAHAGGEGTVGGPDPGLVLARLVDREPLAV